MDNDEALYQGLPPALIKATQDEFTYALGLNSGLVIVFGKATIVGDGLWVHVDSIGDIHNVEAPLVAAEWDRGMDIRISEIAWIADAPFGS